ncbi:MAG: sensor histidine kinase [Clostridia bacterium]|nr:sensor histidine kinase [Clostridia bacterium]
MKEKKTPETSTAEKERARRWIFSKLGETRAREYVSQIFDENEPKSKELLIQVGKWALFVLLIVMEALILIQHIERVMNGGHWIALALVIILVVLLSAAEETKLFSEEKRKLKILFYPLEILAACGILILTEGTYSLILYILILTQFYLGLKKSSLSLVLFLIAVPLYAFGYGVQVYLVRGELYGIEIVRESVASFFAFLVHFLATNTVIAFYRQYLKLKDTLTALDKSKKELEAAYEAVAEVSALEERQRIAKEIHDTAGHSLTTVIMQTEAAKRIIDESPAEAKTKIIAANLQAKNTLERLRESVHLLSGSSAGETLKTALEGIVYESTDGTGIKIRAEIEDITVSRAKFRFLCHTLKEGISNGLRHGGATAFWFELKVEDGKILFLLSDNGKGMESSKWKMGFGMITMREKAKSFGGDVQVYTEAGEGFELKITLPMDKETITGDENGKN